MRGYVTKEEAGRLSLPLRYGDVREDGFVFLYYYRNPGSNNLYDGRILEQWNSPLAWANMQKRKAESKKRNAEKNRAFVRRVKEFLGCKLCGYKKSYHALQFDHIVPADKFLEISKMYGYSRKKLKNEIRKTRVLCANCHAIHTAKQYEEGVFSHEQT